jgi:hypothetical protein
VLEQLRRQRRQPLLGLEDRRAFGWLRLKRRLVAWWRPG